MCTFSTTMPSVPSGTVKSVHRVATGKLEAGPGMEETPCGWFNGGV